MICSAANWDTESMIEPMMNILIHINVRFRSLSCVSYAKS